MLATKAIYSYLERHKAGKLQGLLGLQHVVSFYARKRGFYSILIKFNFYSLNSSIIELCKYLQE